MKLCFKTRYTLEGADVEANSAAEHKSKTWLLLFLEILQFGAVTVLNDPGYGSLRCWESDWTSLCFVKTFHQGSGARGPGDDAQSWDAILVLR